MRPETHYDVLGIPPTATSQEIERAYRLSLELYREDSLATYSLLDPDERGAAKARVEEAYRVLRDIHGRWAYDESLQPEPHHQVLSASRQDPRSPHLGAEILPAPVTGAVLKRFREGKGVTLEEIADRSKVSRRFFEYIEQDRHKDLPAKVYLRGFLQEYARAVGLEPHHTAEAYIALLPKNL